MRDRAVRGRVRGLSIGIVMGAGCCVGLASPAIAQERTGAGAADGAVSPDSAAILRAGLDRPPAKPHADAVDVFQFPFKVALFPVKTVFRSGFALAGLLSVSDHAPLPVRAVRRMRRSGFRPRVHGIGPRSGAAMDVTFDRYAPFFIQNAISLRGSQRHRFGLFVGDSVRATSFLVALRFRRDAQENFWGFGSNSRRENRSDFEREVFDAVVRGSARVGPVFGRVGVAVETNRVDRGRDGSRPDLQDVFAGNLPFGVAERTKFVRLDLSAGLDLTSGTFFQTRGVRVGGGAQIFRGIDGTNSDFHRFTSEVVGYLPVSTSQTLAVRGLMETNDLDQGPAVPLFHQVRFGGSGHGPRGFSSGRFRDNAGIVVMAEWRYEIWRDIEAHNRAEAFLLLDEGTVAPSFSSLGGANLHGSWGLGVRVANRGGAELITYIAFGAEGSQFAVKTQWPF